MVELIMVMGIIGTLAAFMLISFPASQRRGRDTERKSDLKQYQTALEVFANKNNGLYPRRTGSGGQLAHTALCGDLGFGSNECPADPKNAQILCEGNTCEYRYQTENCGLSDGDPCATDYVLWAALEQPKDDDYFTICSDGRVGETKASDIPPSDGACPL